MSDWLGKLTTALGDAGKGAATGAALGPIGAAAGGAIGLALDLVPDLAKIVGKDAGVAQQVVATVQAVTGTQDPGLQHSALADPGTAADLRIQLAQIAADHEQSMEDARIDALKASFADIAGARAQTVQLASAGSKIAWGTPVVSVVVLTSFALMCGVVLLRAIPDGSMPLAQGLLEALKTLAIVVVSYWCGSSAGSATKEARLADSVPASLMPKPAAVVPAADVQPAR